MSHVVLLLSCPDQPGVVAAVSDAVWRLGGNIVTAEQHTDVESGTFFQRVAFEIQPEAGDLAVDLAGVRTQLAPVVDRFAMDASIHASDHRPRLAILASRQPHCLVDLLTRWQAGDLGADIALIASNHPDHDALARFHGIPYHHLPVGDDPLGQERRLLELLQEAGVERVVLARYMRILSPTVVDAFPGRIINIHHSSLPAFAGAAPYRQAHDRGVKLIGATAHYVTAELDEGPIIEQDVVAVSHRDAVADLARKGRDLEVAVLARAVRADLADRVLVWGNRTIVFA